MEQFIYENRILIIGTAREVIVRIRTLASSYRTIRELHEEKMKGHMPYREL